MTVEDATYQQRLEEVLRDKIEEQIHSVRQEPNEIGCGKYVENILAYTLEAINALNAETIGEDLGKRHVRVRNNTHGNCCQCQTCGEDHDDCIMNRAMDEDELRADLRQRFGVES